MNSERHRLRESGHHRGGATASGVRGDGDDPEPCRADGRTLHVANAGDSRAYIVNSAGDLQVTRDHSLVQEMSTAGRLSPDDAPAPPRGKT